MLSHLVNAALRALMTSAVVSGLLIYATGGPDSPNVRPMIGVGIATFFVFWLMFTFMFGKRPDPDDLRSGGAQLESAGGSRARGHRREEHDSDQGAGDSADAGGDGGD